MSDVAAFTGVEPAAFVAAVCHVGNDMSQQQAMPIGRICRALYSMHHRKFSIRPGEISSAEPQLDDKQKTTIDAVLDFYGKQSAQWLSDLTHLEAPWRKARERAGATEGAVCEEEITLADMHEYYSGLQPAASAQ